MPSCTLLSEKKYNMESISIQEPDKKPPALERARAVFWRGQVRIELTKAGTPPSTVLKTAGLTRYPSIPMLLHGFIDKTDIQ